LNGPGHRHIYSLTAKQEKKPGALLRVKPNSTYSLHVNLNNLL